MSVTVNPAPAVILAILAAAFLPAGLLVLAVASRTTTRARR